MEFDADADFVLRSEPVDFAVELLGLVVKCEFSWNNSVKLRPPLPQRSLGMR